MSDRHGSGPEVGPAAGSPRYVFITGGVVSSLGKGIASASLGALLTARGFKVRQRKLDPYLNVDPGTMSPYEHGEVFVTDDGAETDLDLGHYERFTGINAKRSDNVTTGRIYSEVIAKERRGEYLGKTIQVIPHVTDAIKEFIQADVADAEFILCEIGGTVGDIESLPFLEAIRQLGNELGPERACYVHLTLVPFVGAAGELKTKPTQHSVKELQSVGIRPDILLARCEREIGEDEIRKIGLFCNLRKERVIPALNVQTIYAAPRQYHEQGFDVEVLRHFGLPVEPGPAMAPWDDLVQRILQPRHGRVRIAIVGKYTELLDSYKSLQEALIHAGAFNEVRIELDWVNSEELDVPSPEADRLQEAQGILVPGGFGIRGTEGMINAVTYARERGVPYFGICFGMQMAVIEGARNVAGLPRADSSEFGPAVDPVVGLMTEWTRGNQVERRSEESDLGGTMRLGAYACALTPGSLVRDIYGADIISERHRHRYEVNIAYRERLEAAGYRFSGLSPDGVLPEIVERPDHRWFVGVQFHPELKSKPFDPHPLFGSFVAAAMKTSRIT
ncbi:MAG: CTP synthase [Alphaproteobacteria bacterium]|nr:CTP synthase [Alphaproteobacteria bacterium]TAD89474.1 MAG: CTP synthase [Alphaproteobacteria bacterium]